MLSMSPGWAPLTATGPMIECGPRPGLSRRNWASCWIETPGWNLFMKWVQVLGYTTVSPESICTTSGRVASKAPRRTVSAVDSTVWTRPPGAAMPPRSAEHAVRRLVGATVANRLSRPPAPTSRRRDTRYVAT